MQERQRIERDDQHPLIPPEMMPSLQKRLGEADIGRKMAYIVMDVWCEMGERKLIIQLF